MCYLHTNKLIQENIVENAIKIAITVPLSNSEFNTIKTVTTKGPSTGMKMKYVYHHAHTQSYIVQKEGKNQVIIDAEITSDAIRLMKVVEQLFSSITQTNFQPI